MLAPVIGSPASSSQNIVSRYSCSATVACSHRGDPRRQRVCAHPESGYPNLAMTVPDRAIRLQTPLATLPGRPARRAARLERPRRPRRGPRPDRSAARLSHGAVVFDSGLLVFREGLETILVLAAVTASMVGVNAVYRRPIAAGAGDRLRRDRRHLVPRRLGARTARRRRAGGAGGHRAARGDRPAGRHELVLPQGLLDRLDLRTATSARRRSSTGPGSTPGGRRCSGWSLLGLTSVYREGFEVVLFLQNLRLAYGAGTVLEGVGARPRADRRWSAS